MSVVMCGAALMEMIVTVRMVVRMSMLVNVLVRMGYAVMGMLMGVTVQVLMGMSAVTCARISVFVVVHDKTPFSVKNILLLSVV